MNNAELFHRWANRVKDHGNSGNVFYEGETLYSYGHHFPLAVLTGKKYKGTEIVLVNARRRSMTTAHHKSQAVRASSHMLHIEVPYITQPIDRANLEHLNAETKTAYDRLKRVRSGITYAEAHARDCEESAKLYRKTFGIKSVRVWTLPKDFSVVLAAAREREARHNAKQREESERRAKLNALADTEKIAAWRAGEPVRVPWGLPVMLRLKGDDTCETSLGAEIPLDHAERLYKLVRLVMLKGVEWIADSVHSTPAGVYKVDRIAADGTLTAGCHNITFEEIDRFAAASRRPETTREGMEMSGKHTPGPWDAYERTTGNLPWAYYIGHPQGSKQVSDAEAEANACLIAAAPELLEACGAALGRLGCVDGPEALRTRKILRAVIAKAEGRT